MKKVFAIMAIAGAFAACNSEGTKTGETDSTQTTLPTTTQAVDSVAAKADSANAKTDSLINKAPDTLKAR